MYKETGWHEPAISPPPAPANALETPVTHVNPETMLTLTHRTLDRALSVVPVTTRLSDPQQLLKFQVAAVVAIHHPETIRWDRKKR